MEKLARADRWAIVLEILLVAAMLLLLGDVAAPLTTGGFGVVFWLGVVALGLLAPLALHWMRAGSMDAERRAKLGAVCVLAGGLLLRFVIVMAPQWPAVPVWYL